MKAFIMDKLAKVRFIPYVRPTESEGKVRSIYLQANDELGMAADPLLLHSLDPDLLEAYFTLGREVLLVKGKLTRKLKDVIATIVSHDNTCQYCVDAHAISVGAENDQLLMEALRNNEIEKLKDHPMLPVIRWISANGESSVADLSDIEIAEALGVYFYFHYTNRMVSLFVEESLIPQNRWKSFFYRLASWYMSKFTSKHLESGEYGFVLSTKVKLFDWAGSQHVIRGRLVKMNNLLDKYIRTILDHDVLNKLSSFLQNWNGEKMPMGQWWIQDVISGSDERSGAMIRYSLLVMFTPYAITENTIRDMQAYLDDRSLLRLASWSAFEMAKRLTEIKCRNTIDQSHEILQQSIL